MNVKEFTASLANSLTERGIPRDVAIRNATALTKTFNEDDLREITEYKAPSDFSVLTDSLTVLIKEKEAVKADTVQGAEQNTRGVNDSLKTAPTDETVPFDIASHPVSAPQYKTVPFSVQRPKEKSFPQTDGSDTTVRNVPQNSQNEEPQEIILGDDSSVREKVKLTPRGKAIFWLIAVLTSPVWLSVSAVLLSLFVISIASVVFVIALCVALVLGEAAIGCAGTLVGVIYGAMQIFGGSPGVGIYEIGLGVIIAGASLGLAILTYNLAAAVMPYVMKQLLTFWGYFMKRLIPVIGRFREECNRL